MTSSHSLTSITGTASTTVAITTQPSTNAGFRFISGAVLFLSPSYDQIDASTVALALSTVTSLSSRLITVFKSIAASNATVVEYAVDAPESLVTATSLLLSQMVANGQLSAALQV